VTVVNRPVTIIPPPVAQCGRIYRPSLPAASFDHFVRDREHAWGNSQAERLRRLEIDDQLKFGRLQHGKITGLFSLENPSGIDARLTIGISQARAVADQTACLGKIAIL